MVTPSTRIKILALLSVLLCVTSVSLTVLGFGRMPDVQSPSISFRELPRTFGNWSGESVALTEAEQETLDAADEASFRYTNSTGRIVYLHAASWDDPAKIGETCPHHPAVCYENTGWSIVEKRNGEIQDGDESIPVQWLRMNRGGTQCVIGFVYEIGDEHFTDTLGARRVQFGLLSQNQWPCVNKYLAQTSASSIEDARPTIENLLLEAIRWRRENRDKPSQMISA